MLWGSQDDAPAQPTSELQPNQVRSGAAAEGQRWHGRKLGRDADETNRRPKAVTRFERERASGEFVPRRKLQRVRLRQRNRRR
jgi:hypothetical protein